MVELGPGDKPTFDRVARQYRRRWRLPTCAAGPQGQAVCSLGRGVAARSSAWEASRALAVAEAMRWGDATVVHGQDGFLIWAVPWTDNNELRGGVVAGVREVDLFPDGAAVPALDVRRACSDLRRVAEQHNVTNAALLAERRARHAHERQRAEAIHEVKIAPHFDLRQIVWREEPELIAAIRRGDRGAARAVLNRILVGLLHHAGDRFDLVKSFFMELVATVSRTAVEAGGDPERVLGANYGGLTRLARLESLEELSGWLHETLERVMDAIHQHRVRTHDVAIAAAVQHMRERFGESLSRDELAAVAHLSPSHFSRLFRQYTGRTFTEALARLRVNHAAELLRRSDRSLGLIAVECGFTDQSYFTRTFRRLTGRTPRQYRREHAPAPEPDGQIG
jgi:AraC-like DNA-binding protein